MKPPKINKEDPIDAWLKERRAWLDQEGVFYLKQQLGYQEIERANSPSDIPKP